MTTFVCACGFDHSTLGAAVGCLRCRRELTPEEWLERRVYDGARRVVWEAAVALRRLDDEAQAHQSRLEEERAVAMLEPGPLVSIP